MGYIRLVISLYSQIILKRGYNKINTYRQLYYPEYSNILLSDVVWNPDDHPIENTEYWPMRRPFKSVSFGSLLCFFALYPVLISGTHRKVADEEAFSATASTSTHLPSPVIKTAVKSSAEILMEEADAIYDSIQGKKIGLSRKAFECAWKGYKHLQETGQLRNNEVLSICDFSL